MFSVFGIVAYVELPTIPGDRGKTINRGYALVEFQTPEGAAKSSHAWAADVPLGQQQQEQAAVKLDQIASMPPQELLTLGPRMGLKLISKQALFL
jgi:hypothetical protein